DTGKELRQFPKLVGVWHLAGSADGDRVVSGSPDGIIRLWNADSGQEIQQYPGHPGGALAVAISPDGRRIVSGGMDNMVRLWDVVIGAETARFEGHTGHVWDVAFTPDGNYAVSGSSDQTVRLWRLPPPLLLARKPDQPVGEVRRFERHTQGIRRIALSPDGRK